MPHTWYKAVCDEHKEYCDCLVTSSFHIRTELYLSSGDGTSEAKNETERRVMEFLSQHYSCNLRLVHQDRDMDALLDGGYADWLKALPPAPKEPLKEVTSGERFEVWLRSPVDPILQIPVIKAIRAYTPLGLKDAMSIVKSTPKRVFTFATHREAQELGAGIIACGGVAEIFCKS